MEQLDGLDGYAPTRHSCDCPSRLQLRPLVMLRFDIDPYPLASVNYDSINRRLAMRTCTLRHRPTNLCPGTYLESGTRWALALSRILGICSGLSGGAGRKVKILTKRSAALLTLEARSEQSKE